MLKNSNSNETQGETTQINFEITKQKADLIGRLNNEVQRLSTAPDVIALQANQTFLQQLVALATEEAEQAMPEHARINLNFVDGKYMLTLTRG